MPPTQPQTTRKWHFYTGPATESETVDFKIFTGSTDPQLTANICRYLGVQLDQARVGAFRDGEIDIEFSEVRGKDVFVVNSICRNATRSVNDALVEVLLMISALRRASARNITAVLPYYGYARQDRKLAGRVPISAADVARLLVTMGVDRVCSVDLHCGQIQGFFPPQVPVDNLGAGPIGAAWFADIEPKLVRPVVVSPDAGGVARAKNFREMLVTQGFPHTGVAMIIKQRAAASEIERMDLVGHVQGCDCIIVDDMADTAGTLVKAAKVLKEAGAGKVHAFCTHGIFSDGAAANIANSVIDRMVVTNTVPLPASMYNEPRVHVLDLSPILAETIKRLHTQQSLSALFANQGGQGKRRAATVKLIDGEGKAKL